MKILIVDDEQEIREYIANMAEWKELRCEIETAANGKEALEKMEKAKPDVLVTDVRMPVMDGLALAEAVRRTDPEFPILFLSAYHEFDYAKKAIRLGAVDFITKPFVPDDLTQAVAQIREQRKSEFQNRDAFFALFGDPASPEELKREWLLDHRQSDCGFVLLFAEWDAPPATADEGGRLRERQMLPRIRSTIEESPVPCWTFTVSNGLYILLLDAGTGGSLIGEQAIDMARTIAGLEGDSEPFSVSVGISRKHSSLFLLPDAVKETAECMEYRMLLGKRSVIAYDAIQSIEQGKERDERLSIDRLADLLRTGDDAGIRDMLKEAYRRMLTVGTGKKEIQRFCIGLVEKAEQVSQEFGLAAESASMVEIRGKILSSVILTDMMRELEKSLLTHSGRIARQIEQSPKRLVAETKRIIEREYADDLSLQSIAGRLTVNYSYLSRLIKKETDRNFSDLLWETRIEAAKAKLLNEDLKSYEIAYAVGFKDPTHFSLLFKKMVGMSPTAYKIKSLGKNDSE